MLDVLHGFLALYFVDVVGLTGAGAAFAILVWTGVGLLGDALVIPLLERVDGVRYVRASAACVLLLFPAFLAIDETLPKLVLLGALGLLNSGWYSVLAGRLYTALPGQSATAMALGSVFGIAGGLLPLAIGGVAQQLGLAVAMWLLLVGPVALLIGLPRGGKPSPDDPLTPAA
jgi:FSR family fosmidomycin resistance protein-like MFS transporter